MHGNGQKLSNSSVQLNQLGYFSLKPLNDNFVVSKIVKPEDTRRKMTKKSICPKYSVMLLYMLIVFASFSIKKCLRITYKHTHLS